MIEKNELIRIFLRFIKEVKIRNKNHISKSFGDKINQTNIGNEFFLHSPFESVYLTNEWNYILYTRIYNETPMSEFIKFLKNKNAYEQFIGNLKNGTFCSIHKTATINDFCKYKPYLSYISGAFTWASTKEGHYYWRSLSDNWKNYMKYRDINTSKVFKMHDE